MGHLRKRVLDRGSNQCKFHLKSKGDHLAVTEETRRNMIGQEVSELVKV